MIDEEMSLMDRLRGVWLGVKVRTRFRIGSRLLPRMPKEKAIYGGKTVPVCPRCGDLVYYPKQCVSCGQRFKCDATTIGEVIDRDTAAI